MAKKISFYFDEHAPRAVQRAIIERGYPVVMAVDVGMKSKDDDTEHLPYAAEHGLVIFTRDRPFAGRVSKRTDHAGLICWTGNDDDMGGMIRVLTAFAEQHTAEQVIGQVYWLK
jgi:predicted nuclease of predicted toxin-antitoxin system